MHPHSHFFQPEGAQNACKPVKQRRATTDKTLLCTGSRCSNDSSELLEQACRRMDVNAAPSDRISTSFPPSHVSRGGKAQSGFQRQRPLSVNSSTVCSVNKASQFRRRRSSNTHIDGMDTCSW